MTPLQNRSTNGAVGPFVKCVACPVLLCNVLKRQNPQLAPAACDLKMVWRQESAIEEMQKDLTGSPSKRFTTLPTALCTIKNETDLKSRKRFRYIPLPHEPQKIQSLPGKRCDLKLVLLLQTVLLEQGTPQVAAVTVLFVRLRACQANRRCYVITVFLCNYQGWWDSCVNKRYP